MNWILWTLTLISLLWACNHSEVVQVEDNNIIDSTDAPQYGDLDTSEYVKAYLVVCAEGTDYDELKGIEKKLQITTQIPIDEKGRIYRKNKGIILPENSDDEMYAGAYFPRRPFDEGTNYSSIEMKGFYETTTPVDTTTMIVVAAMFTQRRSADSLLKIIQPHIKSAYILPSTIFMGCMH